ncbi:hypothetical protein MRB53_011626 [Persea americana]|uniref:Uncharacterized protein n=1 Tax=Persea americana TaxID=3435 RepID=A0ACC2LV91_PERAE|nr:hypothetical protein MRB53_011626 [Persea americana]
MDSWSYGSVGRGLVLSDEMVSSSTDDALAKNRKVFANWDLKTPSSYENEMLVSGREVVGNQGLGFSNGRVVSSSSSCGLINPKMLLGEEESGVSGASSSVGEYSARDSSLIDLKLGRLADYRDTMSGKSSKEVKVSSSSIVSPMPPIKRSRLGNSNGQTPCCQVHGCNMDLSSSKDYHKRHKVCEIHSKSARAFVNGIEQRFCQQCSRFHLLAEFDDGKRSCRKRLAGHNERRRKPQLDNHSGRTGKMLSSCHGSSYIGASLAAGASFVCSDMFPNATRFQNRSIPHMDFTGSQSIFQNASSGAGEFGSFNTSSTVEGVPRVSDSGCALSLLSAQSQNSSTPLSAIPMARPLIVQGRQTHYSVGFPDKLLVVSSQPATSVASNRFSSPGMEDDHMGAVLVSDDSNVVTFDAQAESDFHRSRFLNTKDSVLCREHDHTIDLLPLSSQLQSGELQRHSTQVKQESGTFCYLPIT